MMDKLEHFIEALVEWVLHGNSPRPSSCETSAVKAFSSLLAQVDRWCVSNGMESGEWWRVRMQLEGISFCPVSLHCCFREEWRLSED